MVADTVLEKPAFEGLTEFDERTQLANASLPKKAARVFHAHGEQFLRRLSAQTMQVAMDQLKTRATAAMVASVTRPLRRVQKYSFVAPKGVVRFSHKLQSRLGAKLAAKGLEEKKPKASIALLKATGDEIEKIRKEGAEAGFA